MQNKSTLGQMAVIMAACLWGCIGIFTRGLTAYGLTSFQIVFVRAGLTTVLMAMTILIKDPSLFRIRFCDLWMFLGTGIASFAFFNICYMTSMGENSLSVACVLMYTSPIWVTLISSWVFHEKCTSRKWLSLAMCFLGCICICLSSAVQVSPFGLLVGILSGIGYALYSIFGKLASRKYAPFTITLYTFLFATIALLPLAQVHTLGAYASNSQCLLYLISITVVNTVLPYLLYTFGLSVIEAGKAAVLSIAEPAVATLVGSVAFSEAIGLWCTLGILIILIGLLLQNQTAKA